MAYSKVLQWSLQKQPPEVLCKNTFSTEQACNQEFFRSGEVSENKGTLINI